LQPLAGSQVENVKTGTVLRARDALTAAGFGGARVRELNVNAGNPRASRGDKQNRQGRVALRQLGPELSGTS
jgi:hypothetical protein